MAISAQELNIILTARDKQFQKAMTAAEKKVGEFSKNSQKNLSNTAKSFSALGTAAKRLGPALIAAFSVRAIANVTNSAVELGNLAAVAGVSVERFQELAFAGAAFGVSQEKMADILKDVNDKFGDYLTTGAGPLDDFFENIAPKIGLTAKAFEGLSSDQKIGKYVQALQAANLSQERMTFFMEALASDSTLLLRAFADGGAELDRLSGKLRDAGGVISSEMIEKSRAAQEELRLVSEVLSKNLNAGLELVLPLVTRLTRDFDKLTTAAGNYFRLSQDMSTDAISTRIVDQTNKLTDLNGQISTLKHFQINGTKTQQAEDEIVIQRMLQDAGAMLADIDAMRSFLASRTKNDVIRLPPIVVTDNSPTGPTDAKTREAAADMAARPDKNTRDAAAEAEAARRAALLAGSLKVLQDYTDALIAGEEASADMNAEELSRLESVQSAYDSVRGSLDPLYAATQQYAEAIQEVNAALAEGFISEEQAAKDREGLLRVFETAKAEASELSGVMETVSESFATAFGDIISGTSTVEGAFRKMAGTILTELFRIQSQQMMSGGGGGSLLGSLLSGLGSVFGGGGGDIPGLASGGPMAAGSPAVVGEHGREIFVPSSPGRILSVPQSKAAVNGGGGTTINQTINVTTGIQQTVRAEIQSLMPQIAAASTKAVLDARRRGGSFAGAFS